MRTGCAPAGGPRARPGRCAKQTGAPYARPLDVTPTAPLGPSPSILGLLRSLQQISHPSHVASRPVTMSHPTPRADSPRDRRAARQASGHARRRPVKARLRRLLGPQLRRRTVGSDDGGHGNRPYRCAGRSRGCGRHRQRAHTDGGALVQRLYGHRSERGMREQIRSAFGDWGGDRVAPRGEVAGNEPVSSWIRPPFMSRVSSVVARSARVGPLGSL